MARIEIIGLSTIPEITAGANLADLIAAAWTGELGDARPGDVVVVTQKIVSKAEGCAVRLSDVEPSAFATAWGRAHGKDPHLIELILRESRRIVRMDRGILIVETHNGFVCANAAVDSSNVEPGWALTLPRDPDASAERMRIRLQEKLGSNVGVIISDTFGRPWREGLTNVAIGLAGVRPIEDYRGVLDTFGHRLETTMLATADEIAAAAELVMGKTQAVPVAVVRGLDVVAEGTAAKALIRKPSDDLFR